MKKLLLSLLFGAAIASAQSAPVATTLALPVTPNSQQALLSSTTGVKVGYWGFVDREAFLITGLSNTVATIQRGIGGTKATAHGVASILYIAPPTLFVSGAQSGSCINAQTVIDSASGNQYTCSGTAGGNWALVGGSGGGTAAWGGITGTLSNQGDLVAALAGFAPIASPSFTGTVTAPLGVFGNINGGTQLSNSIYAAPCGTNGPPVWRGLCPGDIPTTIAANTTGTAGGLASGASIPVTQVTGAVQSANNGSDFSSSSATLANLGGLTAANPQGTGTLTLSGTGAGSFIGGEGTACVIGYSGSTPITGNPAGGSDCLYMNAGFAQVINSGGVLTTTVTNTAACTNSYLVAVVLGVPTCGSIQTFLDANGNTAFTVSSQATGAGANNVNLGNSTSGTAVTIGSVGTDPSISLAVAAKGAGIVKLVTQGAAALVASSPSSAAINYGLFNSSIAGNPVLWQTFGGDTAIPLTITTKGGATTTVTNGITATPIDGVPSATMAFVDPTSSIQTQLNGKLATTGTASTASALAAAPTLCGSGSVAQGILANGNATGCTTVTATTGSLASSTYALNSGAGTGGSPAITNLINGAHAVTVQVVTGSTTPTGAANVFTITPGTSFASEPSCWIEPVNASANALTGTNKPFFNYSSSTASSLVFSASLTAALGVSTTYQWVVSCW